MYIQIRSIDATTKFTLDVSKKLPVSDLKRLLEPRFGIRPDKQRLFYRGKQMEDDYCLFDYNVNLNDVVQIMEKAEVKNEQSQGATSEALAPVSERKETLKASGTDSSVDSSLYFMVGELVDAFDRAYGAWFEGIIKKIFPDNNLTTSEPTSTEKNKLMSSPAKNDTEIATPEKEKSVLKKTITKKMENAEDCVNGLEEEKKKFFDEGYLFEVDLVIEKKVVSSLVVPFSCLRPRARLTIPLNSLKVGDKVLGNYNVENPKSRGFWYDCIITKIGKKGSSSVFASVSLGSTTLDNCQLIFTDQLMKIEQPSLLEGRVPDLMGELPERFPEIDNDESCEMCKRNPKRKCKECGCHNCGLKTSEDKQIVCDECQYSFHIWCLKPPMEEIPDIEEWFCPDCKNDENEIVNAGEKLKESKKKAKMASKQMGGTTRDWGKGMACVGRNKVCTIVPSDHFGPIPGVEVGTSWKFRIQVSEAGVHRPHVAGIHGQEKKGAFSIVLSGGYEDDEDNGDEVLYTGAGGRDLSGNKRTNSQGFDQSLAKSNRALAMNCNVPINPEGAEAKDWRAGKPVRVIRNYKAAKHSKYAPEDGNRYDGIYKVVKYFTSKGKSGFAMWRFVLRRDDPTPAPWTKEGQKRMKALGLEMQYPEGYEEAMNERLLDKAKDAETSSPKTKGKKGEKRVLEDSQNLPSEVKKKAKISTYKLEKDLAKTIDKDEENEKLWKECVEETASGKPAFMKKVEETFTCICCTEVVFKPVTTQCRHNFCSECLRRSFSADVMTCPTCRAPLEKEVLKTGVNNNLQEVLNTLFPGYSASR